MLYLLLLVSLQIWALRGSRCDMQLGSFKGDYSWGGVPDCLQAFEQMPEDYKPVWWYKPEAGSDYIPSGFQSLHNPLMFEHGVCSISVELGLGVRDDAIKILAAPMLFKGLAQSVYEECIRPGKILVDDHRLERPGGESIYFDVHNPYPLVVRIRRNPAGSTFPPGILDCTRLLWSYSWSTVRVWHFMQNLQHAH